MFLRFRTGEEFGALGEDGMQERGRDHVGEVCDVEEAVCAESVEQGLGCLLGLGRGGEDGLEGNELSVGEYNMLWLPGERACTGIGSREIGSLGDSVATGVIAHSNTPRPSHGVL